MDKLTPDQIRAENIKIRQQLGNSGPRATAILLAVLSINEDLLRALSPSNIVHVDFRGSK